MLGSSLQVAKGRSTVLKHDCCEGLVWFLFVCFLLQLRSSIKLFCLGPSLKIPSWHMCKVHMDICARPGLFSPWLILYPHRILNHSLFHMLIISQAGICSPVPTQFLSVCPSQKSPSAPGAAAFHGFWGLWRQLGWRGLHTLHELYPPLWITRASAPDDTKSWLNAHFCSRKCVIHQHKCRTSVQGS